MKLLNQNIIFVLLLVVFTSCTKREVILTEDTMPDDIFYLQDQVKPFSGKAYVFFKGTEKIKEVLHFKNGILNGERVSYHSNGQMKFEATFRHGEMNGKCARYDNEGNKIYEVEYSNDTLIGNFISWYSTGVIREKGNFNENHKSGEWIRYDQAGMIVGRTKL